MALHDMEGNYVKVNQTFCDLLGYTEAEFLRMNWRDVTHPDDVGATESPDAGTEQGLRENFAIEKRYVRKDQSVVWARVFSAHLRDAADVPQYILGQIYDITELKQAEEELRNSQEIMRALADNLPAFITLKDTSGRFLFVNKRFEEWVRTAREDVVGKTVHDIYAPEQAAEFDALDRKAMLEKRILHMEVDLWYPDGNTRTVFSTRFPLLSSTGKTMGLGTVNVDITELKRAKEQAEHANRSKSEFLASMSHEIRTPMAGVLGMADILLDDDLSDLQRKTVLKIKGAGQALITILNDILDLSKIQAGKLEIEYIDFDLRGLVSDTLDLLYPKASEKGLALASKIDPRLPAGINSDPTRIRQILVNLLGNAIKFTDRGDVTLRVGVDEQIEQQVTLRFEVVDTGIGIAMDRQNGLFEDFTQLDASTARKYEGTGLGLAISKRLTELMRGEIGVESIEGKGSTFWFTVSAKIAATEIAEKARGSSEKEFRAVRPLHILLAEDNDLNQMIITTVLSKFGHTITAVDTGRAAVDAVRDTDFDLVLMDVRMPEMDGPDATRIIRQAGGPKSRIPVIAVTADAIVENRKDYFEAGMNACVTKPINVPELLQAINEVMTDEIHVHG